MFHCMTNNNKPKHFKSHTMYHCMTNNDQLNLSVHQTKSEFWKERQNRAYEVFTHSDLLGMFICWGGGKEALSSSK